MINLPDYKKIHCIGIGGIGLSAVAEILMARGYDISGSDMRESDMTAKLAHDGAQIYICLLYTSKQASNEVFGTNVKLTKDMLIIAPEDDRDQGVKTTIDPSGMKITDNRPGQNLSLIHI